MAKYEDPNQLDYRNGGDTVDDFAQKYMRTIAYVFKALNDLRTPTSNTTGVEPEPYMWRIADNKLYIRNADNTDYILLGDISPNFGFRQSVNDRFLTTADLEGEGAVVTRNEAGKVEGDITGSPGKIANKTIDVTPSADNDVIAYDAAQQKWVKKTLNDYLKKQGDAGWDEMVDEVADQVIEDITPIIFNFWYLDDDGYLVPLVGSTEGGLPSIHGMVGDYEQITARSVDVAGNVSATGNVTAGMVTTTQANITTLTANAVNAGTLTADDVIAKGPIVDVRAFGAKGDGLHDDTAAIQAAIDNGYVIYMPAGKYIVSDTIIVPAGKSIIGATDAFFRQVGNVNGLSVIYAKTNNLLFVLCGGNHIKNLGVYYVDQTYDRQSLIDTGTTFSFESNDSIYSKGCYIESCSVCGGTTIIKSVSNSDYIEVYRLAITPNHTKPSVIIDNMYDTGRLKEIHVNPNVAWMYQKALSNDILSKIYTDSKLFSLCRIDDLKVFEVLAYGIAYPITIEPISNTPQGGATFIDCTFDNTYRVLTCDATITNFGITFIGLKAVFVGQNNSCIFNLTDNSIGSRIQASNIYITAKKSWSPVIADTGSTNNRIICNNYNFFNPSDIVNNGTDNAFIFGIGCGGSNGLFTINGREFRNKNFDYKPLSGFGCNSIQRKNISINCTQGQTVAEQSFTFDIEFSSPPKVFLTLTGDSNVGAYTKGTSLLVKNVTKSSFTVVLGSTTAFAATGVWVVNVLAIGNE